MQFQNAILILGMGVFGGLPNSAINRKLYSINRLFYLPFNVKLQFFKSFLLPYFDYGISLMNINDLLKMQSVVYVNLFIFV
jgi:hypothetical protein